MAIRRFDMLDPDQFDKGIAAAVATARRGGLVVCPTEAAYGIATDAFSNRGLAALREAKHRGDDLPVPVMVGAIQTVDGILANLTPNGRELMRAFWPGALTLVGRAQPTLTWRVGATDDTHVSVRMPLHPVAWNLARQLGPLALSGANLPGADLPRECDSVATIFGTSVGVYLDAGEVPSFETSTTVDVVDDPPTMLRAGAIAAAELSRVCPDLVTSD